MSLNDFSIFYELFLLNPTESRSDLALAILGISRIETGIIGIHRYIKGLYTDHNTDRLLFIFNIIIIPLFYLFIYLLFFFFGGGFCHSSSNKNGTQQG